MDAKFLKRRTGYNISREDAFFKRAPSRFPGIVPKQSVGTQQNRSIGRTGEIISMKYLAFKGYNIVDKNFRTPFGEIDIVATKDGATIFFEVKTRISDKFGYPLASITRAKQKSMIKNFLYYMKQKGLSETPSRVDAIAVILDHEENLKLLEHVKDVLAPDCWGAV